MRIQPHKIGLLFGMLLGGTHFCWSLLVLLGWAQPLINFIFWAHMIQPVYVIKAFDPVAALTLILITTALGYLAGVIGGALWNRIHRPGEAAASSGRDPK